MILFLFGLDLKKPIASVILVTLYWFIKSSTADINLPKNSLKAILIKRIDFTQHTFLHDNGFKFNFHGMNLGKDINHMQY